jgi:hypothetical protein
VLGAPIWRARPALHGAIGPLEAIAAIRLAVGGTVDWCTDAPAATRTQQRRAAPAQCRAEETRCMKAAVAGFTLYKAIEIALLAVGGALALRLRARRFWLAFGPAPAAQGGFMLGPDPFAEARGAAYLKATAGG